MSLLVGFFVSCILCLFFIKKPLQWLMDQSGHRSLHVGRVPRSGGIAIFFGLLASYYFFLDVFGRLIPVDAAWAVVVLAMVSFLDDVRSVPVYIRLLVQILVSGYLVWGGDVFVSANDLGLILKGIIFVAILWMINLYNFMDGMDGFAAGMALIGFATLSALGYLAGDLDFAMVNAGIVAVVAGFWCWNFPPAKLFMGDVGSTVLGVLVGIMALQGWGRQVFPLWVPILLFSPFWVDASYTLIKRLLIGQNIWQAHREHFYQRLVLSGMSHRQVVLAEYLLMLACALAVLLPPLFAVNYNGFSLLLAAAAYLFFIVGLEEHLSRSGTGEVTDQST